MREAYGIKEEVKLASVKQEVSTQVTPEGVINDKTYGTALFSLRILTISFILDVVVPLASASLAI